MYRTYQRLSFAVVVALAAAAGGCTSKGTDAREGGWFTNSFDLFSKPDWARPVDSRGADLGPKGPVAAEDLVAADGSCAPAAAQAAQASAEPPPAPATTGTAPADRAVGSPAGDLAGAPMPASRQAATQPGVGFEGGLGAPAPGAGSAPPVLGGISLGMSECDAVRRAGQPSNVAISAGDKGERRVVLTYLTGPWPGIYTFDSGRLKVVERAPEPPKPAKPAPKKKAPKRTAR